MTLYIFTVFYLLLSICIVYPPIEFVSAGLTIKDIFANWLGSENEFFIQYHIRRIIATLFVHSMLPFGYVLGLVLSGNVEAAKLILGHENPLWPTLALCSLIGPTYSIYKVLDWSRNNWATHPIAKNLAIYCNNNTSWINVASDINIEYRRIDKILIDTNSVTRIVATDNWIIKITPYKLHIAHQSDTALIVNKSDTHLMSPITRGEVQFVNIEVKPTRPGASPFSLRLNALDFKDLQDKVSRPITILENVTFHRTVLDRFIDTFKEEVAKNPHYETAQELDQCIGCMQTTSNVKLNKLCDDGSGNTGPDACFSCYCRPMWCLECMAKWFASRQNENATETWLSSKCTCPVCRAKFCLLDVCIVKSNNQ